MELYIPLMAFVVVSTITPGPNNLLLASSGIRFGFLRTVPHIIGIHLGVYLLVILCGVGLGQILLTTPYAVMGLKLFGTAYLLYLAYKIIGFRPTDNDEPDQGRPMSVPQALLFQFANPKAWMMATTGLNLALAVVDSVSVAAALLCAAFATVGIFCNSAWVLMGTSLRQLWQNDQHRTWLNLMLGSLTLATVISFWLL